MCKCVKITLANYLVIYLLTACTSISSADFFDFEVRKLPDIHVQDTIVPTLVSEAIYEDLISFRIADSLVVFQRGRKPEDYFFYAERIADGQVVGQLCRRGRGPGEMVSSTVNFEMQAGRLFAYDFYRGEYNEVDVLASLSQNSTIRTRSVKLEELPGKSMLCVHPLPGDELLLFDSASSLWTSALTHTPCFSVFDLSTGEHKRDMHVFKNIPQKESRRIRILPQQILAFHDCIDDKRETLCFVQNCVPQVNYLNVKTGDVFGIRLMMDGAAAFSPDRVIYHFMSVDCTSEKIFALYFGKPAETAYSTAPLLYVFDWEGNILGKHQLDQPYVQCRVSGDHLFLNVSEDWSSKLYSVEISSL